MTQSAWCVLPVRLWACVPECLCHVCACACVAIKPVWLCACVPAARAINKVRACAADVFIVRAGVWRVRLHVVRVRVRVCACGFYSSAANFGLRHL